MAIGGALTYATWKLESSFKGSATGAAKSFGHSVKLSSHNIKNNVQKLYTLGNVESQAAFGGAFEASAGIDFVLADPWIWAFITGNNPTTTGSSPYTHTFVDTTLGTPIPVNSTIPSIQIEAGANLSTDSVRTMKGCVFKSISMDLNIGEPVSCKLDFDYATEQKTTALGTNVLPTDEPFNFAQLTFEFPTGTSLTLGQSMNLTINRNPELIGTLGNRLKQDYYLKKTEYSIKFSKAKINDTMTSYAYGNSSATEPQQSLTEATGIKILFDNGASSTSQRQLLLEFEGAFTDELDTAFDIDALVKEDITFVVRKWKKCIAINNTATMP